MKAIDPGADAERVELDLELDAGLSISVRVLDQQDRPLRGVNVWGRTADRPEDDVFGPQLEVINFSPEEMRTVMFRHFKRDWERWFVSHRRMQKTFPSAFAWSRWQRLRDASSMRTARPSWPP